MEALGPAQRGGGSGGGIARSHGMRCSAAALLEVLLEARRQRQAVDETETDAAEDGELGEMTQRVHAAKPRQRAQQADGRRRQAGSSRSQVVEAAPGQRLGDGRLDELGDSGAAVTLRLSVEAEHTYSHHKHQPRSSSLVGRIAAPARCTLSLQMY